MRKRGLQSGDFLSCDSKPRDVGRLPDAQVYKPIVLDHRRLEGIGGGLKSLRVDRAGFDGPGVQPVPVRLPCTIATRPRGGGLFVVYGTGVRLHRPDLGDEASIRFGGFGLPPGQGSLLLARLCKAALPTIGRAPLREDQCRECLDIAMPRLKTNQISLDFRCQLGVPLSRMFELSTEFSRANRGECRFKRANVCCDAERLDCFSGLADLVAGGLVLSMHRVAALHQG